MRLLVLVFVLLMAGCAPDGYYQVQVCRNCPTSTKTMWNGGLVCIEKTARRGRTRSTPKKCGEKIAVLVPVPPEPPPCPSCATWCEKYGPTGKGPGPMAIP